MKKNITLLAIIMLLVPLAAMAARYTINGDGTVTDNETGLMWQQNDDNKTRTWKQAITYCENLVVSPSKYSDWRLPNRKELHSIVNSTQLNPAIDPIAFPNTDSSYYWSSTTIAGNQPDAWGVDFSLGKVYNVYKTELCYVRCVRGGQ